jgi:putative ABC transport system permease protein
MNPFVFIKASMKRHKMISFAFVLLVAVSVGLGVGISSQERALRKGTARSADKFDLLVAAPGSKTEMLFNVVFLESSAVELLKPKQWAPLLSEKHAVFAAPFAFGDSYHGFPVIGTTPGFVSYLVDGNIEGRMFKPPDEAMVGTGVPLSVGSTFTPAHGQGFSADAEGHEGKGFRVVGQLAYTGTPWDRAIILPVESVWNVHAMPNGHDPEGTSPDRIGPPFDPDFLTGVPAVILKPDSVAAAYGLRNKYRTEETMAFFPAEVLVQLYQYLGDVTVIIRAISVGTQLLVMLAIITGLIILMQLYRRQFAVFRALGASKSYVFCVVWTYAFVLIAIGSGLGLALGYGMAHGVSLFFIEETGIYLEATIGKKEVLQVLITVCLGLGVATIPAINLYRLPVIENLK